MTKHGRSTESMVTMKELMCTLMDEDTDIDHTQLVLILAKVNWHSGDAAHRSKLKPANNERFAQQKMEMKTGQKYLGVGNS